MLRLLVNTSLATAGGKLSLAAPHGFVASSRVMIRSAADYRRCCEELEALGARPAALERSAKARARVEELRRERALYEALLREGLAAVPVYAPEHRGRALVDLRVALRMPQNVLAERLGVSAPVISRDEASAYEGCSLERYGRILRALGVEESFTGYRSIIPPRGGLAFNEGAGPAYRRTSTAGASPATVTPQRKRATAKPAKPAKRR